jgi:hypothetical protein
MKSFVEYIAEANAVVNMNTTTKMVQTSIKDLEKALTKVDPKSEPARFFKKSLKRSNDALKALNAGYKLKKSELHDIYHDARYRSNNENIIKDTLKGYKEDQESEAGLSQLKNAKPFTICDILKYPNPDYFIDFMNNDVVRTISQILRKEQNIKIGTEYLRGLTWVSALETQVENFTDWFEEVGGSKRKSIKEIRAAAACKDRAAWTKWSGTAWRGVGRSLDRIKRYNFTGEMVKMGGVEYLVATTGYKGKYGVQSWTNSFNVAQGFAAGGDISVIFEVKLSEDETFLRPEIIKEISHYRGEKEILRVSDKAKKVKVYVKARSIADFGLSYFVGYTVEKAVRKLTDIVGKKAAEALLKNKDFRKKIELK